MLKLPTSSYGGESPMLKLPTFFTAGNHRITHVRDYSTSLSSCQYYYRLFLKYCQYYLRNQLWEILLFHVEFSVVSIYNNVL